MSEIGTFDIKSKILLVDDMPMMRRIYAKLFRELGFQSLTEAGDGAEAWKHINDANPPFGLIISDWAMPTCSGLDLLKRLRGDGRYSKVPFLMILTEAERAHVEESEKAGANACLTKPFSRDDLIKTIRSVYHQRAS